MSRILADENISPALILALRETTHDVRTVHDLGLGGDLDEHVLQAADQDSRILLTADKDFGFILELGPLAGHGRVILLRYHILNWDRIAADLGEVLNATRSEFEIAPSLLVVVSEGQFRVRRWSHRA